MSLKNNETVGTSEKLQFSVLMMDNIIMIVVLTHEVALTLIYSYIK